jgi:hypothetical protein
VYTRVNLTHFFKELEALRTKNTMMRSEAWFSGFQGSQISAKMAVWTPVLISAKSGTKLVIPSHLKTWGRGMSEAEGQAMQTINIILMIGQRAPIVLM